MHSHYPCVVQNQTEHLHANERFLSMRSQAHLPRHNVLMPRPTVVRGASCNSCNSWKAVTPFADRMHATNAERQAHLVSAESQLTIHAAHSNCPAHR
jgi:hypothetical protein